MDETLATPCSHQQVRCCLQALLVRRSARLLKQALSQTDERSKLEGEVIGGIDVIKCSAWEVRPWWTQIWNGAWTRSCNLIVGRGCV